MRLTRSRPLGLVFAGLFAMGVASAQPAADELTGAPPAEGGGKQEANLSPEQQVTESHEYLQRMELASGTVRRQLEQARAAKDVVKTICLNDKLTQIDIATRTSRDRVNALEAAVASHDTEKSQHDFTILQVLRDRVHALESEANQCIGEETGFLGESSTTVNIDPTIPHVNPDDVIGHEPPHEILDSPVLTSPIE